ncbi:MAG: response regulator [Ruminococcus sp.]|nr:response regulator [Ruminococcus sp.]
MDFLLTDDNEINIEIGKIMLEKCGLSVDTAMSGQEAVSKTAEKSYRMIFMDINMPGMNGFQAAEAIHRNNPEIPIIALSADDISHDNPDFIRSGMNGTLLKPLKMENLQNLLSQFIETDSAHSASEPENEQIFSADYLIEVMGSERSVLRLISQFLSNHSDDCIQLCECIQDGDFIHAREILHNITGISGNMYCMQLYKASSALSNELKQNTSGSLEHFTDIWDSTISELNKLRAELLERTRNSENSGNPAVWSNLREQFLSLSDDFDTAAVDLFTENAVAFENNMNTEKFRELRKAVLNYDFLWISENRGII